MKLLLIWLVICVCSFPASLLRGQEDDASDLTKMLKEAQELQKEANQIQKENPPSPDAKKKLAEMEADAKAEAARQEKELGYREPPIHIRPVGETEGAAFVNASAWNDARAAYQRALIERPNSGFPLYGLALVSEKAGDAKTAATQYNAFVAAWQSADPSLPQLAHARAFLADHGTAVGGN